MWFGIISMFYGAFAAYRQKSFRFVIAYSSLAHMGLILAGEAKLDLKAFVRAAQTLDLDGILEVARAAGPLEVPANSRPDALSDSGQKTRARIAIARDAAFNFYYADALETLLGCGAQLVPFSPLEDKFLPEADGLFIGGGYPELHAAKLAANTRMLEGVRAFCASGKPVVAECGGLMYLAESLTDLEGRTHAMCAVIPAKSRMLERPILGYREVIALEDSAIALAGTTLRGHEFHYSSLEAPSSQSSQSESRSAYRSAYRYADGTQTEGFVVGNILASYIHLHFASDPALAQRFVTNAVRFAPPVEPPVRP